MICRGLMKSTLLFVAMVAIASRADTQSREEAEIYGARAGICVSVVDDDNMVVSNAEVEVYFGMAVREGKTVRGVSDKTGNFAADGKTTGEVYVNVRKNGFYHSAKKLELFADESRKVTGGRWMPEMIPCRILLRRIHRPVRLVTSGREKGCPINAPDVWMGFDIEKCDWVPPHGGGVTTDFEVMYNSDGKKLRDYTGSKLTIRFSRPFDGAYVRTLKLESDFQTDFEAMTNALYQTVLEYSETKTAPRKWEERKLTKDQFLVLRVRSRVNANGEFMGAHYGMIMGPMSFGFDYKTFGVVGFHTFFNPTFNDPGLEKINRLNTPGFGRIGIR